MECADSLHTNIFLQLATFQPSVLFKRSRRPVPFSRENRADVTSGSSAHNHRRIFASLYQGGFLHTLPGAGADYNMTKIISSQFQATQKGILQKHIKSIHEGQKFPCPLCEYKATEKGSLQKHIKSVHEGLKIN